VSRRRAGRTLYVAAEYTAINALIAYLTENCGSMYLAKQGSK